MHRDGALACGAGGPGVGRDVSVTPFLWPWLWDVEGSRWDSCGEVWSEIADKWVLGIPSQSRRINREMIYRMLVGRQPFNGFYRDRDEKVVE
jgi:hypothetical protein